MKKATEVICDITVIYLCSNCVTKSEREQQKCRESSLESLLYTYITIHRLNDAMILFSWKQYQCFFMLLEERFLCPRRNLVAKLSDAINYE